MSKITCPYCGAEMNMKDATMISDELGNRVIFYCQKCHESSVRAFHAAGSGRNYAKALQKAEQPDTPADHFADVGKMVHCKDCAHLEYEDLGIYYCGLHRITGQLSPDDYCSRAAARKEENP